MFLQNLISTNWYHRSDTWFVVLNFMQEAFIDFTAEVRVLYFPRDIFHVSIDLLPRKISSKLIYKSYCVTHFQFEFTIWIMLPVFCFWHLHTFQKWMVISVIWLIRNIFGSVNCRIYQTPFHLNCLRFSEMIYMQSSRKMFSLIIIYKPL